MLYSVFYLLVAHYFDLSLVISATCFFTFYLFLLFFTGSASSVCSYYYKSIFSRFVLALHIVLLFAVSFEYKPSGNFIFAILYFSSVAVIVIIYYFCFFWFLWVYCVTCFGAVILSSYFTILSYYVCFYYSIIPRLLLFLLLLLIIPSVLFLILIYF